MKHSHCTGTKRERRNASEQQRLEAMGAEIAKQFTGKTPAELLALATGKDTK